MSILDSEVSGISPDVPFFGYALTTERTNEILFNFARTLLDRLSEAAWQRAGFDVLAGLTSNDVPHLCNYDPDVWDLTADDQTVFRQISALFSKRADIEIGIDKRGIALEKFLESERTCGLSNSAFRAWKQGRFQFFPDVESILHGAQRKISDVLGRVPSDIRLRFGPGASTATPKKNACPVVKLKRGLQCSTNFPEDRLSSVVAGSFNPALRKDGDEVDVEIHTSLLAFVPKNFKTDRAICTEPLLNSMHQNGLGDYVSSRLRRVGIDIRDQSANQRAALYGSISNESATLDLSSASDSISTGLVEHLLPEEWYLLLSEFRTAECLVDGRIISLEKISSMGNGFTFPLETLIFWALAEAVKDRVCANHRIRTLVYGDDIITPVPCVPLLTKVLRCTGFTLNSEKSFWDGTFRESCGCDYVLGKNVRPVYVKEALTGASFFRLRNFFHRMNDFQSAMYFEERIDQSTRIYGPDGYGDGHLVTTAPVYRSKGGLLIFTTFKQKGLKLSFADKLAPKTRYWPQIWDPNRKEWTASTGSHFMRHYKSASYDLVRNLATYTAYQREHRVLTLTESDALRSHGRHVYVDRRMPDPQTRNDEDFFVVPGAGSYKRTNICIFGSLD